MSTPQLRSRELLTERGYLVATVESVKRFPDKKKSKCRACGYQPEIRVSVDLFNVFDILAIHPEKKECLFVQVTSANNHATRRNKVLSSFEAKLVLLAGSRIVIQSWRKDEKINRWKMREEEISLEDFRLAFAYPNTVRELQEIRRKKKKNDYPPGNELKFSPILDSELPF